MFPLKDENPTRITPFVTFLIIAASALIYFGPQEGVADELRALDFNLEYAAIPCEIRTGEPLSGRGGRGDLRAGQLRGLRRE